MREKAIVIITIPRGVEGWAEHGGGGGADRESVGDLQSERTGLAYGE